MKLVVALQYYAADMPQAERLLRLIADIERAPRSDVEILVVRRFDAPPMTDAMVYAADKFKVSSFKTSTPWTGWPAGPNGMALDLLNESLRRVKSGEWADVDGLLMIEPDCVPCVPNWLDQIATQWSWARDDGRWMMGSWRNSGGEWGHLNGNSVVVPDLARRIDLNVIGPQLAWDCAIVGQTRNNWQVCGLIRNAFDTHSATEYDLKTPEVGAARPVLYHGCKDRSAIEIAERWLKL